MSETVRFYFDYVDPLSYLVELCLRDLERAGTLHVARVPFELCPPPTPLLDPDDSEWALRWREARAIAGAGTRLVGSARVPWTRKAHELVLHAESSGLAEVIHEALFKAVFEEGMDVGRVDLLVGLATRHGLDLTSTKAVLDVDRYSARVLELREEGAVAGIHDVPALVRGGARLEGFHNAGRIRTFLDH